MGVEALVRIDGGGAHAIVGAVPPGPHDGALTGIELDAALDLGLRLALEQARGVEPRPAGRPARDLIADRAAVAALAEPLRAPRDERAAALGERRTDRGAVRRPRAQRLGEVEVVLGAALDPDADPPVLLPRHEDVPGLRDRQRQRADVRAAPDPPRRTEPVRRPVRERGLEPVPVDPRDRLIAVIDGDL